MKSFVCKLALILVASAGVAAAQTTLTACSGMTLGTNGALNGFVPGGADAWHTDVTNAAVDPNSATILLNNANDLMGAHLHPDFGSTSGIPYNVVDSSQTAGVPVAINMYAADSDITLAPIPSNVVIEGNPLACPTDQNDRHLIVVDRNKCVAYEYWQAGQCNGSFSASNTALWDLSTPEKRPFGLTSADAAGLSVFEGLVRYDEIVAGAINHAIRFTASHTKNNANGGYFVNPATHAAGNNWSTDNLIGMRLRLKADFDISGFSKTNQIILAAMKKYGMILADNGSSLYFQGTTDNRWDDNDLHALTTIPASAFDVVTEGTSYDAATMPTGSAPTISSFTASATTVAPGTAVTLTANTANASYNYVDNAGFLRGNTVTVTPTKTTTYTLNSRNAYGTTTKSVTVTVSATAAPTSTSPTSAVAPALSVSMRWLGGGSYIVTYKTNSPAPVTLSIVQGTGTISQQSWGIQALFTQTGTLKIMASQPAVAGFTAASAVWNDYLSKLSTTTAPASTSTSTTPTSTSPTSAVAPTLNVSMRWLGEGRYIVMYTTNSPAPVTLSIVQGTGTISQQSWGTQALFTQTGTLKVMASQPAVAGFKAASAVWNDYLSTLK